MISLNAPLLGIKGIGPKFLVKLKKFNIETVKDLLWHFPFRYDDFSQVSRIADLKLNQQATIQGVIEDIKVRKTWRRKLLLMEALVSDDSGSIKAVWFNQKFLLTVLKRGRLINLAGKVAEGHRGGLILSNPAHELITAISKIETKHTGRLVPIYPETRGMTSKAFRYLIKPILNQLEKIKDSIPDEILKTGGILEINEALNKIHFPKKINDVELAKKRFAFEDIFYLQLINIKEKLKLSRQKAHSVKMDAEEIKKYLSRLPFELTVSQKKTLFEILRDLEKNHPMNRLLQGDVGSGKTIVAVLAALMIAKNGKQTAFMAPTEVLAVQHYQTFKKFFGDFEKGVGLITSSVVKVFFGDELENTIKKNELSAQILSGEVKIIFGTHSLIQKNIKFKELALVVIDEQHRFGVRQRAELIGRESVFIPHFLSMSATPIPRTLFLTVFGDLNLSVIDELPKGRKEIITKIVAPENRDKAYAFIRGQVKKGRQVFVICPRIEPTEDDQKLMISLYKMAWETKTVKEEYEKLSKKVFPDLKIGMLHGKLKAKEKNEIMQKLKNKEIDILISTSVIEVGVDIPNTTIMMIESSERFGLAQLYQFRGRVGRGEHQSFCFLFTELKSRTVFARLKALIEAKNGFELAEMDLKLRGPGEFLGASQTGLPDLAMRSLQDPGLVKTARDSAEIIIKKDSELANYIPLQKRLENFQKQVHLE
ncbi:MAG: ATP-dependent DNA helicase RecG [Patescibacteria group bacterium]|nr:ATP-dependent DNA helicase RecG [Patescibacteria group bacterium]